MFQVLIENQETWREDKPHRVQASVDCEITVSPSIAQRHARAFLAGQVTLMTSVGVPTLVIGAQPVWRVPAYFNLPQLGEVALLGSIDVDAVSGQVIPLSPEQISAMQQRAHVVVTRLAPPTAATS